MPDTMQICLNGHVINDEFLRNPKYNKDYCDRCGKETITRCPNRKCDKLIPGRLFGSSWSRRAPSFCEHCGEKFPWTRRTEAKRLKEEAEKPIEALQRIFYKFDSIARKLRNRYNGRETLDVSDEYDVQDLLSALFVMYFDDIRPEESTPSFAGKSDRMDFLLKKEKIVIEVKMARQGLADKEIRDQLLIDIESYKGHPDCDTLICFVYDPDRKIANAYALSGDLQSQSRKDLKVIIVVEPS